MKFTGSFIFIQLVLGISSTSDSINEGHSHVIGKVHHFKCKSRPAKPIQNDIGLTSRSSFDIAEDAHSEGSNKNQGSNLSIPNQLGSSTIKLQSAPAVIEEVSSQITVINDYQESDYFNFYNTNNFTLAKCLTNSTKTVSYEECHPHDTTTTQLNQTKIISLVNYLRQHTEFPNGYKLNDLVYDDKLQKAAQKQSDTMSQCLIKDHHVFPYLDFKRRLGRLENRKYIALENVAYKCVPKGLTLTNFEDQLDSELVGVYKLWEGSHDHWFNVINPNINYIAVARRGPFWTMILSG